jgi:hypothetical protein
MMRVQVDTTLWPAWVGLALAGVMAGADARRRHGVPDPPDHHATGGPPMSSTVAAKWIYDFAEGSRSMRELLGGKGSASPR